MRITSPAFEDAERIPQEYSCDGDRHRSPPLAIADVPETAKSLVLIMDDPDIPQAIGGGVFTHWVLFNIPPTTLAIPEGTTLGTAGVNTAGSLGYTGPCPPRQYEPRTHRYFFKLYALDTMLDLAEGVSREEVETAISGHLLASAEFYGTYSKN